MAKEKKLKFHPHANGCELEGEYEEVVDAVKAIQTKLHDKAPRVATDVRFVTETDRVPSIDERIKKVQDKMESPGK